MMSRSPAVTELKPSVEAEIGATPRSMASPLVDQLARPSLHDAIVNRVRDMITEGVLASGARIHEGQLGQTLGVSRTPLREALKFLASEGLVELVPGRGAVVRRLTPKDISDTLVVIAALEELAGRLACMHASADEITAVRLVHDRMLRLYAERDRLNYFKANQEIHSMMVRLSGNPALVAAHAPLQARLKRIRYIGNGGETNWAGAVADHEEMMAALEARDAERLARALSVHLAHAWDRVQDSL